jgi:transposase
VNQPRQSRRAARPRLLRQHLKHDLDAVTQAFTTPWNSGPAEGRVNHKMIKPQMSGRAGLPLLRVL